MSWKKALKVGRLTCSVTGMLSNFPGAATLYPPRVTCRVSVRRSLAVSREVRVNQALTSTNASPKAGSPSYLSFGRRCCTLRW